MKHRALSKRIISILLALQMVVLQPLCSFADIPQHRPTVIEGARLSEDRLTDGDLVYFGVSGLTVKEASDTYEIAIYREGDLDSEASVTVHTLDISALYNKDYRLMGDNIKELDSSMTLLERAAKSNSNAAENDVQGTEYNFDENGNLIGKNDTDDIFDGAVATPTEVKKSEDTKKTGSTEKATNSKKTDSTDRIKDANTTEHTDEVESSEKSDSAEYNTDTEKSGNADIVSKTETIDGADEVNGTDKLDRTEDSVEKDKHDKLVENKASEALEDANELKVVKASTFTEKSDSTDKSEKTESLKNDGDSKDADQSADTDEIKDKAASGNTDKNDNKDENDVIKDKADTKTSKSEQDKSDADKTSSSEASKSTENEQNTSDTDKASSSEASKSTVNEQDTDEEVLKGTDEQDTGKDALKDEDKQGTDETDLKKEYEADDAEEPDERGDIEDKDKADSVLSVAGSDAVSTGKSRLAILKEEATGEPTREEGSSGVSGSLTDAILAQIMPEQIEAIPHSAEQTITFAPGENVQYLKFRIHDDKLSEGTEAFSVMITDAENMEPYMVTSLSVIITDDEESEQSEISFDSDAYAVDEGKALVTLQREGAEYSMASVNIRGKDAETGANQVYGTVVFAPYETEKEVELAVTKDSTLYLSDYLAAQAGNTTEADAIMADGADRMMLLSGISMLSDEDEDAAVTSLAAENAAEDLSFDIDIAGKKYKVKYKKGDVVADIYDENYTPALEVGQYYFSASTDVGGIFSYGTDQRHGSKPNKLGTLQNRYVIANEEKDFSKGYGKLEYLHTTTWCTGSVWSSNEHPPAGSPAINGLYYQYLIPHWAQTSSYGGGNKVRLKLHAIGAGNDFGQKDRNDKFGKELSSGAAVKVQNIADNIEAIVYAVDDWKTMTPKSYMQFYGIAAMYKKYRVNVENPDKKSFLGAPASVPMQVKMECGAQIIEPGHIDSRNIYTNVDTDDANIVFTLNKNTINGVDGIFGTITGYTITISPDDNNKKVTVDYPSGYLNYLDSMVGKSVNSDAIDLSKEAVKTVKERATAHLDTIVMDKYFVNWIESIQKTTYHDSDSPDASYYQKLSFKPTVAYTDVKVSVAAPDAGGVSTNAHFTDTGLPAVGSAKVFHAGDTLDLSAVSDDRNYRVTGFEISDDGGVHFNSIRDTHYFTLRADKNYVIRPLLAKNDNHVEIEFESEEARKNLSIENLIPQDKLNGTYLKGKNIINLNPEESSWTKMMQPSIGAACTVRVLVTGTPSDTNYVYRPVITDRMTGKKYQTQGYSFILRSNTADNVLKIGIEKVKKSELAEYSLSGTVVARVKTIRETGLAPQTNPAEGYAVSLANGEFKTKGISHVQLQSATADNTGIISLAGIKAKEGDRISLLIDNGMDDAQVADFVFGSGTLDKITNIRSVDAGMIEIHYPITAPVVTSISYDYDKSESRQKTDLRKNQVRCFDDNLKLTAIVDQKKRSIDKLVFTVRTVTGAEASYEAKATAAGSNVFTATIPSMLTNLHNGDRITVYIVDKEKRSVTVGDTAQSVAITYPTVDTGLVSYVENEVIAPKEFNIDGAMGEVNIPLLGAAKSTAQSGILNFSRLDYPNGTGFSLNINFDMMLKDAGSMTAKQKADAVKTYQKSVQKTQKLKKEAIAAGKDAADAGASADQIRMMVEAEDRDLSIEELNSVIAYDERQARSNELRDRKLTEAKNERANMTKTQGYINVRVIFNLGFEFLYDPVKKEYVLATTAVTVGGALDASKTFYTMVGYVPCFLNLSGGVEVDLTMGGVCPEGKNAYNEGDFNAYSGNVQNIFSGGDFLVELDSVVKAKVQVGAGLCGVLSARGYVSVLMKLQLVKDNVSADPYGIILNAAGGIGFDLVLLSMDVDIAKISQGWGNYAGRTKVEYFNNLITKEYGDTLAVNASAEGTEGSNAAAFSLNAISEEDEEAAAAAFSLNDAYEEAYAEGGGDEITFRRYDMGSDDMSGFERSGGANAQPTPVHMQTLMDKAASRTRPEMVMLPDGRYFAVFIAASPDGDSSRLYYTIGDKKSRHWSNPVALDTDGSYDSMPALTVVGDKVVIAWMDASEKIEGNNDQETMDAYKKKFNAFNISGIVYNAKDNKLGKEFRISPLNRSEFKISSSDLSNFYLQAPSLCTVGDKVYCTYVARDISGLTKLEELSDLSKGYSTAMRATLNIDTDPVVEKNEFVVIKNEDKTDPLVIDYQTDGIRIDGTDYLVTAFTLDNDDDLKTGDRQLYLGLCDVDVKNSKNYYPIKIGSAEKCQAVPKLTKVNGRLVLSWTEDGEMLELLDVSGLIESLFHTAEIGDKYSEADGAYYEKHGTPDYNWYKKTAEQLGLKDKLPDSSPGSSSGTEYEYRGSYYEAINNGDFRNVETRLKENEEHSSSIDDYTIAGDGRDLYVFYTDFGPEIEEATVELYGRRYRMAKDTSGTSGSGGTTGGSGTIGATGGAGGSTSTGTGGGEGTGHHSDSAWGFTDAVCITDLNQVIDDFTLTMDTDGSITLLSDFYKQWIDDDGHIQFGQNALVEIDFERGGSLDIDDVSIDMDSHMIAGETSTITFDVVNAGLLEAKGFTVEAELMENGTSLAQLYKSGVIDRILDTNESATVQIPWEVPDGDLNGKSIKLIVAEKATTTAAETTAEIELKSEAKIALDMEEVTFDKDEAVIPFEISNIGNAASTPCEVVAYALDGADKTRLLGSIQIPALASGESKEEVLRFTPKIEDWNGFGRIDLELAAVQDGTVVRNTYGDIYSSEPVLLDIEDGTESIDMSVKAQQTLKVQCAPWDGLCTDLRYISSDSKVASVDDKGTITAVGNGSCTIEVYSPDLLLKDTIIVNVSGGSDGGSKTKPVRNSSSDYVSELSAMGLPSWVERSGRWIQNDDGSWSYLAAQTLIKERWVCIYNPYADEEKRQKRYGWFKFGPGGKMLTGWIKDADGSSYYLNPNSDGTRGMMLIGWQLIDGKWYYFSEAEGSGIMGALLRNTVTPDGYRVDNDGVWIGQ